MINPVTKKFSMADKQNILSDSLRKDGEVICEKKAGTGYGSDPVPVKNTVSDVRIHS